MLGLDKECNATLREADLPRLEECDTMLSLDVGWMCEADLCLRGQ